MTERKFEQEDGKFHYQTVNGSMGYELYIPYSDHKDIVDILQTSIRTYQRNIEENKEFIKNLEGGSLSGTAIKYLSRENDYENQNATKKIEIIEKMLKDIYEL